MIAGRGHALLIAMQPKTRLCLSTRRHPAKPRSVGDCCRGFSLRVYLFLIDCNQFVSLQERRS